MEQSIFEQIKTFQFVELPKHFFLASEEFCSSIQLGEMEPVESIEGLFWNREPFRLPDNDGYGIAIRFEGVKEESLAIYGICFCKDDENCPPAVYLLVKASENDETAPLYWVVISKESYPERKIANIPFNADLTKLISDYLSRNVL